MCHSMVEQDKLFWTTFHQPVCNMSWHFRFNLRKNTTPNFRAQILKMEHLNKKLCSMDFFCPIWFKLLPAL